MEAIVWQGFVTVGKLVEVKIVRVDYSYEPIMYMRPPGKESDPWMQVTKLETENQ